LAFASSKLRNGLQEFMMPSPLKIFGISGSLRKGSFNRMLLRTAQQLTPEDAKLESYERLGEIPPFNQDEESSPPPVVVDLKHQIRGSDAILIVTPEYNYSVPGVLKNAIDWASRPYGDSAWKNKPVAIMGASPGILGSARAQYHLRQMFVFLDMYAVNQPEVMIAQANQRFDREGNLTDETSKKLIRQLLERLVSLAHQVAAREAVAK
jgi:chromate reductase